MPSSKVLHWCHQLFNWSHYVHWSPFQLEDQAVLIFRPLKWAKKAKIGPKLAFSRLWPYGTPYFMEQVWMRLERPLGHPGWAVWPVCQTQKVPNVDLRVPKKGQNRQKKSFWPHKSTQRTYFGLEEVDQDWNTNKDIQTYQFRPFTRPRMSLKMTTRVHWDK